MYKEKPTLADEYRLERTIKMYSWVKAYGIQTTDGLTITPQLLRYMSAAIEGSYLHTEYKILWDKFDAYEIVYHLEHDQKPGLIHCEPSIMYGGMAGFLGLCTIASIALSFNCFDTFKPLAGWGWIVNAAFCAWCASGSAVCAYYEYKDKDK